MAGILSVDRLQVTLGAGTASANADFTQGQSSTNCVPFASKRITTVASPVDNWSQQAVDITMGSSFVTAATNDGATRALVVEVPVVEFDSALVKVQQGTFSMTATTSATATLGSTLASSTAAAMVFNWQNSGAPATSDPAMVRGVITDTETLTFTRQTGTGNCTGHYYVFEALSGAFGVQQIAVTLTGAASNTGSLTAVSTNKTFLIGSYEASAPADDNSLGSCDITLTNSTTITVQRNGTTGNITANVFAVEFSSGGNEAVQRGTITGQGATASQDVDFATSVSTDLAMPWLPSATSHKTGSFPGTGSSDNGDAQVAASLVGSTAIRLQHSTSGGEANNDFSWELVEWEISLDKSGNGALASADSSVSGSGISGYLMTGVTKNNAGSALGNCEVALFKQDETTPAAYTYMAKTTSDGSGNYSFVLDSTSAIYMTYAIKPGSPNVFDASDNVLVQD